MRALNLLVFFSVCVRHGCRLRATNVPAASLGEVEHLHFRTQLAAAEPLKALALSLLTFNNPIVGWQCLGSSHSCSRKMPRSERAATAMQLSRRACVAGAVVAANVQDTENIRVVDLRVYPVKSCGGISLSSSRMAPTGLEWDRVLAVVDNGGNVQTQRLHTKMAAIRTSLNLEAKTITLETDSQEPLTVPMCNLEAAGCKRMQTSMGHGDPVPAWLYPKAATDWLTLCLAGTPGLTINGEEKVRRTSGGREMYHLVRFDDTAPYQRRVMNDVGGDNALPQDQVAFPDLFPFLITTQESLKEVDRRVPSMQVTMDRFRPNIVVAGSPKAFDEDSWAVVEIGEGKRAVTLRCLEQDPRCQMPTIDQRTGKKDAEFEPSRTLRRFRKLPPDPLGRAGDLASEGPMFGIYAAHGGKSGELHVGDILRILERSTSGSLHEHWSQRYLKSV